MRTAICCTVCLCLICGCCSVDKALQRALDAYLFESGFVVKGLVSGMELTDPVYTSNFANGPFLVWDWPCWLAWRISRVLLVGVGFGLFSHEAWEEVARTGKEIKMLVQQLFSASEK